MINKRAGYLCLLLGTAMLSLSFLTKSFAAFLLSLALMAFASILFFPRARSAGLVAGSTLAAISIAEVVVALFLPPLPEPGQGTRFDSSADYAKQYFSRSTDLGSLANPGVHSARKLASDGEVIYDVRYSIGADGFRLTPGLASDAEITTRINFFGGSFTFGEGLNDDETLPYFVASAARQVSVKNYGFHGYGPHQALAILQSDRDTTGDVNFFMTSPWHAQRSACVPAYSDGAPKFVLTKDQRVVRNGECRKVAEEPSNIEAAARKILGHSHLYRAMQPLLLKGSQDTEMELYFAIIGEMARLSRSRSQDFIVGYVKADEGYLIGAYSNETVYEALNKLADDIVDLTLSENIASLPPEYYIHALDRHPSELANKQRAQLVSQLLMKRGLSPVSLLTN